MCSNKDKKTVFDLHRENGNFTKNDYVICLLGDYEVLDKDHLKVYEQLWINKIKNSNTDMIFDPLEFRKIKKLYTGYEKTEIKEDTQYQENKIYNNGKVYIITHDDDDTFKYIGSTCQTLLNRLKGHLNNNDNTSLHSHIQKGFDKNKYCICLLKKYTVADRRHLTAYEQLWMNKIKKINNIAMAFNPLSKLKCQHDKIKNDCKKCHGKNRCPHNRIKSSCKDCGGIDICSHNRIKKQCKECKEEENEKVKSVICEHDKQIYKCKICKGVECKICHIIVSHSYLKRHIASHDQTNCKHGLFNKHCKECCVEKLCDHNKQPSNCKICNGIECVICNKIISKAYFKEHSKTHKTT
jgi:hypothetical protein